jgi:hypothetical protein
MQIQLYYIVLKKKNINFAQLKLKKICGLLRK